MQKDVNNGLGGEYTPPDRKETKEKSYQIDSILGRSIVALLVAAISTASATAAVIARYSFEGNLDDSAA